MIPLKRMRACLRRLLLALACLLPQALAADPAPPAPAGQQVQTGIYLMNVYDLDVNAYSFHADFYLWFRWKGKRDPMKIEFANAVEAWSVTKELFYDTAQLMPDGYWYNGMRVDGRFYHPFELSAFPLDKHSLAVMFEHVEYPADSIFYVPDAAGEHKRPEVVLPGWQFQGLNYLSRQIRYETFFGRPDQAFKQYSSFGFEIHLARPLNYFLFKLLLPLLIVVLATLGALLILPGYIDARMSLPVAGLLTAVFLQQSYSSALPDIGYMVLMDKLYLASYLLIAGVMLRIIIASNRLKAREESLLRRMDLRMAALMLGAYLLGLLLLVMLR